MKRAALHPAFRIEADDRLLARALRKRLRRFTRPAPARRWVGAAVEQANVDLDRRYRSADRERMQPTLTEWVTIAVIAGLLLAVILRVALL